VTSRMQQRAFSVLALVTLVAVGLLNLNLGMTGHATVEDKVVEVEERILSYTNAANARVSNSRLTQSQKDTLVLEINKVHAQAVRIPEEKDF